MLDTDENLNDCMEEQINSLHHTGLKYKFWLVVIILIPCKSAEQICNIMACKLKLAVLQFGPPRL